MSDQKQDKGSDKTKDTTRAKDTSETAARESTINSKEQQRDLQAAHESNPDRIPEGDSVGQHLTALRPGMTLAEANEAQARVESRNIESFGIDMGDGKTVTAADKAKNKALEREPLPKPEPQLEKTRGKLAPENLTSDTMQALAREGPENVRDMMRNVNEMRDSLKQHLPPGAERDDIDKALKSSVIESLPPDVREEISHSLSRTIDAKLTTPETTGDASRLVTPETSGDAARLVTPETTSRGSGIPSWIPQFDESTPAKKTEAEVTLLSDASVEQHHEAREKTATVHKRADAVHEVEEVRKPAAEGPSGTLIWKDKNGYHQGRCIDGKVVDAHNKPIGSLKDGGVLTINGQTVDIDTAANKSNYMFIGADSSGHGVKYASPQDAGKLTGALTSFDGKTHYTVVGGNIFDDRGAFKGHLDEKGHVERMKDGTALGKDADVNVLFNRFKFEGTENGQKRFFVSSSDASNGTMMVPGSEIPGYKGDAHKMVKLQVREGMLIDPQQHDKQVGVLFAPNTDAGQLAGGCVVWSGAKNAVPLGELKNSSFDLKMLGEGGHAGRSLKGVTLGKNAGLFDVQAAMDVGSAHMTDKITKAEDSQHQGLGIFKWAVDEATGGHAREKATETQSNKALKADLDSLIKNGVTDPKKLADVMHKVDQERKELEPQQPSDAKGRKPSVDHRADPEKQVGVPKLTAQNVGKVDGSLIMDGSAYQIHKGQLYRIHDDGHGHMKPDAKASGKLLANYHVQLDGVGQVDLAHENRVLMKFTVEGEKSPHRVLGMGRTRVTDGGSTINGGLVSVDDISRKAKATVAEEKHANEEYFKNRDVMTNITQGIADKLSGGSAESGLASAGARYDLMLKTFDKACDKLFTTDPAAGEINTKLIDHNVRTVQTVMETFGLEVADERRTRGELKEAHSTMNEAASMAAITVATMGVGTLVSTAANAGKFATFGRFAHAATIGARVGGGAVTGGTIRAVGGYHEGQSGTETAHNFVGGSIEGGIMSAANLTGSFDKAQKLSRGLALAKGVTEDAAVAGKMVPKAFGQIDEILQAGGIKQTEAFLLKSGIGRAAGTLTDGQAVAAKIGLNFVDNFTQSASFGVSNYYRNMDHNPPGKGPFDINEVAFGTLTGMLGHGTGDFLSRDSAMFKRFNEGLPPELRFNAGDVAEQLITQAPKTATSGFGVGVCNAIPTEFDRERQRLADETGMDIKSIGIKEILEHDRLGHLLDNVAQSASLNALASMPGTLAHGVMEQKMGVHTEDYVGTPELGKSTSDSLFKPIRDRLGEHVADSMLNNKPAGSSDPPTFMENIREKSVELSKRALDWSPSTVSKVERFNRVREQIAALPEEMQGDMAQLLGKIGEKGVDSDARLRIVENLFTISDTTNATGLAEMHQHAKSMNDCMAPMHKEQAERPAVPKLEEIFDREQVELIKAMDAAQARLKPVEIEPDAHRKFVEDGYQRAIEKAPSGIPARDKIIHFVVGPPGAGKSSSLVNPFKERDRCIEVDSDDVKPTVAGYVSKFRGMDHVGFGAGIVHPVSSKVAHDVLKKAMDNGDNIIHPILGRTPEGVLDLVMEAKAKGYRVAIHLADVPPEVSSQRAFDRGQKPIDKEGKRQMVPATYSLDVVKWGPQITFDRLTQHAQGLIDELNYCNTNQGFDVTPNIEQRSPKRMREGVEEYIKQKPGKDSDEDVRANLSSDAPENEIPVRVDSVDPANEWNRVSDAIVNAESSLHPNILRIVQAAVDNGSLVLTQVDRLKQMIEHPNAPYASGAHLPPASGSESHKIYIARMRFDSKVGDWVTNQNPGGTYRHELSHFLDEGGITKGTRLSNSDEFREAWLKDVHTMMTSLSEQERHDLRRYLRADIGRGEVFAELLAQRLGGAAKPNQEELLRRAFPECWNLIPDPENLND